ncbi:MAG: putative sensor protein, partial [bacterium]
MRPQRGQVIGAAPPGEMAWVLAHGRLRKLAPGQILTRKSAGHVEGLFFVLSGHLTISVDRGAGPHKVLEWRAGDVTGLLPYSRMIVPPGDVVAQETTEVFMIPRDDIPAMIRDCHEITSKMVHIMVDRARQFTSSDLHDEKMVSLGKLAAGLAHELNNPASALARSAKLLPGRLATCEEA